MLSFGFRTGVGAVMRFLYIQIDGLVQNQSVVVGASVSEAHNIHDIGDSCSNVGVGFILVHFKL